MTISKMAMFLHISMILFCACIVLDVIDHYETIKALKFFILITVIACIPVIGMMVMGEPLSMHVIAYLGMTMYGLAFAVLTFLHFIQWLLTIWITTS